MIIGAVSQATDPAKKLADDYCAYVLAQTRGVVNYATVYSIYKNEILTDPDYLKMTDYWDVRAGKRLKLGYTDAYDTIYSLLPPYRYLNHGSTGRFTIDENGRAYGSAGSLLMNWTPTSVLNEGDLFDIREVTKIYMPENMGANIYLSLHYDAAANVSFSTRAIATTNRIYGYLYATNGTTYSANSLSATPYRSTDIIITHETKWSERYNRLKINGETVANTAIPVDAMPRLLRAASANHYFCSTLYYGFYYLKYYKNT